MGSKPNSVQVKKKRIFLILKSRHLSINKLANAIGYTRQGLSLAIHREKMDAKTLDDICKYLDVYPGFFTGDYPLRKLKPEILKNGIRMDGETWDLSAWASDPSGYDVPKYYFNKRIDDLTKSYLSRNDAVKNAFLSVGSTGFINRKDGKTVYFDADFVNDNFRYLIPTGTIALEKIALSVMNNDEDFRQFKDEEIREKENESKEQLPDLWDVYQDEDLPE